MKYGLEEELIMWIMKTSITQIWMVCHLLPFAKVGQYSVDGRKSSYRTLQIYSWIVFTTLPLSGKKIDVIEKALLVWLRNDDNHPVVVHTSGVANFLWLKGRGKWKYTNKFKIQLSTKHNKMKYTYICELVEWMSFDKNYTLIFKNLYFLQNVIVASDNIFLL